MNHRTAGETADRPWSAADLVWLLGSLCRIHRIPFDAALVARQYPPPHSVATFIEAAAALGLKVGDIVCYKASHLKSLHWFTNVPINGKITKLEGDKRFANFLSSRDERSDAFGTEKLVA